MSRRDSLMVLVRSGGACALPLSVGFFLVTQYNFRHVLLYRASYARSLGTSGYSRGHSASLGPPPGCARGVSVFVVLQLPHFRWLRATRSGLVVVYFDKWLRYSMYCFHTIFYNSEGNVCLSTLYRSWQSMQLFQTSRRI